jgi:hypothetical protein
MVFKRPNSKFETGTFSTSKNLEKFLDDRVDQGKQFSFWSTFKIETEFELEMKKFSRI